MSGIVHGYPTVHVTVVVTDGQCRIVLWGTTAAQGAELAAIAARCREGGGWCGGPCNLATAGVSGQPGATPDGCAITLYAHPAPCCPVGEKGPEGPAGEAEPIDEAQGKPHFNDFRHRKTGKVVRAYQ